LVSGVCNAWGAGPVITADIRQHCLDAARERLGATHDFLLPDTGFADKVCSLTGGEGVDVVFLTADDVTLVNLALDIVKRRGRIVFVALMTDALLNFPAFDIIAKEITLVGSLMANHDDVRTALDLAASGRVDVEGILTHRLSIEDAQHGMELAHSKAEDAIKVVLEF
jgi:threonine dehydrogenase-like Zn-dependent dehydrogenase